MINMHTVLDVYKSRNLTLNRATAAILLTEQTCRVLVVNSMLL